jgi:NDP-sugar pyrophosphorylase family protein
MISQAAILCGGLGTRLGALTADTPKPLLVVAGQPFLDILLGEFGRQDVRHILLLAGFAGEQVRSYAEITPQRTRFDLRIEVVIEPEPAGTGGAIRRVGDRLAEAFFLLNGDSWFDIELADLAAGLSTRPDLSAAIALRRLEDASRYGAVALDGEMVARFAERPDGPGPGLVSGGVYAMRRQVVEQVATTCSLERDVFPVLASAGSLAGRAYDSYFIDIGIPEDFRRAQHEIPARLAARRHAS